MSYYKGAKNYRDVLIHNNFMEDCDTVWDPKCRKLIPVKLKNGMNKRALDYYRAFAELKSRYTIGVILNNMFIHLLKNAGDEEQKLTANMFKMMSAQAKTANVYRSLMKHLKNHAIPKDSEIDKYIAKELATGTERIERNMAFINVWAEDYGMIPLIDAIWEDTGMTLSSYTEYINDEFWADNCQMREDNAPEEYYEKRNDYFLERIMTIARMHHIDMNQIIKDAILARDKKQQAAKDKYKAEKKSEKISDIVEKAEIRNTSMNAEIYRAIDENKSTKNVSDSCITRLKSKLIMLGGRSVYITISKTGRRLEFWTDKQTWAPTPYNMLLVDRRDKTAVEKAYQGAKNSVTENDTAVITVCELDLPPEYLTELDRSKDQTPKDETEQLKYMQRRDLSRLMEEGTGINFTAYLHLYMALKKYHGRVFFGSWIVRSNPRKKIRYMYANDTGIMTAESASHVQYFSSEKACLDYYRPFPTDYPECIAVNHFEYELKPDQYETMVKGMSGSAIPDALSEIAQVITVLGKVPEEDKHLYECFNGYWQYLIQHNSLFQHLSAWPRCAYPAHLLKMADAAKTCPEGMRFLLKLSTSAEDLSRNTPPSFLKMSHVGGTTNILSALEQLGAKNGLNVHDNEKELDIAMRILKAKTAFSYENRFSGIWADIGNEQQVKLMNSLLAHRLKMSGDRLIYGFADLKYDIKTQKFKFSWHMPENLDFI